MKSSSKGGGGESVSCRPPKIWTKNLKEGNQKLKVHDGFQVFISSVEDPLYK